VRIQIANSSRVRGQYEADLLVDGRKVGKVEKGFVQSGFRAGDYIVWVNGTRITYAPTLQEVKEDLRDPAIQAELESELEDMEAQR
jgi:membrane-associated protease RseP (regulator of RpoE activity)